MDDTSGSSLPSHREKRSLDSAEEELRILRLKLSESEEITRRYWTELCDIKEKNKMIIASLQYSLNTTANTVIGSNTSSNGDVKPYSGHSRKVWSEDMDNRLRAAVEANQVNDKIIWNKVVEAMGGELNRRQCVERWNSCLKYCDNPLRCTKFTPEEDDNLRRAISECDGKGPRGGLDWVKVSELMGKTRSPEQCRLRWSKTLRYTETGHLTTPFEPSEDKFLLEVAEKNTRKDGSIDWVSVAKHFNGTRTPIQCCSRRRVLMRPKKTMYQSALSDIGIDITASDVV